MDWKTFFATWRGTAFASRAKDILIVLLLLVMLGQVYVIATQDTVVTMNPPPSADPVQIGQNEASPKYKQLWAIFVAELAGNLTPENADRVRQSLGPFLASDIRNRVMQSINRDIEKIQRDDVTASFSIREVQYDINDKERVYVTGDTTLAGVTDDVKRNRRTYVIDVGVTNYQPQITYFNTHSGEPS